MLIWFWAKLGAVFLAHQFHGITRILVFFLAIGFLGHTDIIQSVYRVDISLKLFAFSFIRILLTARIRIAVHTSLL
jgi:hypothetical protein